MDSKSAPEYQHPQTAFLATWDYVKELWPSWDATKAQKKLWEKRLTGRGQTAVREALEQVASERTTSYPRLGWVLQILKGKTPLRDTTTRFEVTDEDIREVIVEEADIIDTLIGLPRDYLDELLVEGLIAYLIYEVGALISDMPRLRVAAKENAKNIPEDVASWDPMLRGLVWEAWRLRT